MSKLFYCASCRRVFEGGESCIYCEGKDIKELLKNSPVNILGTKLKGRILKMDNNVVRVLLVNENKERLIKEYEANQLKKII